MAAPCKICSCVSMTKMATEMVAAGASDQAIADKIGNGVSRMAISRHRRNHIMAPAQAVAAAAAKGADVAAQRAQVMAAAEAGDPAAFIGLAAIVSDLRRVHDRLEQQADEAARGGQRLAVSALSAQQIRASEVRARMGGHGAYGRQAALGPGDGGTFAVHINFNGETVSVSTGRPVPDTAPVIEGDKDDLLPE